MPERTNRTVGIAASQVDGEAHARLTNAHDQDSPDCERIKQTLRQILGPPDGRSSR
jgi:hypothetical protein